MEHKTIIRTNDPDGGDGYVTLLILYGVSYPITSSTRLVIDGDKYAPVRSEVDIVTAGQGSIVTTVTVVADSGS
jgi:hypothetical protein